MRRAARILLLLVLYGVLLGIGVWAGLVTSAVTKLDALEARATERQVPGVVLARDNRTVLRRLRAPTSRTYLETKDLPDVLVDATVAAEDRRFFEHSGIDVRGLARAALVDLRARAAREGGSTITQQLVKNTYVGPEQTVARKSREALFAVALETRWSKQRILATYLNTAYFGGGRYGVVDAARGYFGVFPGKLTPAQAALLAALLRSPEGDNPATAPLRAKVSRDRVLRTMRELGSIDDAQLATALRTPLPPRARLLAATRTSSREIAPQFADAVTSQLIERFGVRRALGAGLRVRTTIDAPMQRAANDALARVDELGLDAALVAIDVKTGEVRAMANGGAARRAAFNVALDGHRQPGSAFKPFMLAAAYDAGLTPKTKLRSAPFSKAYAGGTFTVKNDGGYAGDVSLERATWKSDNTVYARLQDELGIGKGIDMARASGVQSRIDEVPAAVLGALPDGVTPTELANAYATFARHGERISMAAGGGPRMVSIAAAKDTGERWRPAALRRDAMSRGVADMVTATLQGVLREGTGSGASIGRPAAGKTGTTEDYRDAWFVGYTPSLVVAVWVGHAQAGIPMRTENGGGPVTGGSIPASIWRTFMQAATTTSGDPERFDLEIPTYVTVLLDPTNGLLAGPWCADAVPTQVIEGTEPTTDSVACRPTTRAVPDMRGRTPEDARDALEADEFTVAPGTEEQLVTTPAQDGLVVAQDPAPGTQIERDEAIRLTVGTSPFAAE